MKLTLTGLRQHDRKIQSIKALRNITAYGLRETLNIVDGMITDHRNGNTISCVVTVRDPGGTPLKNQFLELAQYFDFTGAPGSPTKTPIELKLWEIITETGTAYILASTEGRAINMATHSTSAGRVVIGVNEIKGPFNDGHILFISNIK
jgi:hypothetical protein